MESSDVKVVQSGDAFTLDVQIYVSNGSPERVQTVTLCNVLAFVCRCPICDKCFATTPVLKMHMKCHAEIETSQSITEVVTEDADATGDDNYTCVASVKSGEQHFIFITQEPTEGEVRQSAIDQIKKRSSPRVADKEMMSLRPYQCSNCDLGFTTRTKLNIHNRTHTGEKPFECETCQKAFATRGEVTVHARVHTGEKPYTCVECGTCHRTRSALHGHIHRYHQERAYKCDTCNKTFAIRSYYQAHLRIHNDDNPFKCKVCEKIFPYQSFLDKHMNTHSQSADDGTSPGKKKKVKRRRGKGKKGKTETISTEEKEKIAVEVLQKGRAAGDANQETLKTLKSINRAQAGTTDAEIQQMETDTTDETPVPIQIDQAEALSSIAETSTTARVISSGSRSKETVLQIETMKNGTPEMIYVTLAESDLQQVTGDGTQLTLVQESVDSSQLASILPSSQLTSQNIQFVNDADTGMVVVTEAPVDMEQVIVTENDQSDAQAEVPQVAAILSETEVTTSDSDPTEYARRVDAVVQELEKRINTNE